MAKKFSAHLHNSLRKQRSAEKDLEQQRGVPPPSCLSPLPPFKTNLKTLNVTVLSDGVEF